MSEQLDVSVIIATYNRASLLPEALSSVLNQQGCGDGAVRYEVIIVDNNSPDDTREVVNSFIARGHKNLTYLFEGKQGVAHARNHALAVAKAPIIAFTDDDVRASSDWVSSIKRSLDAHGEVSCAGGKVLPIWRVEPPEWLTSKHWSPLALVDYGDHAFYTSSDNPRCLVTANLAFRREVFDQLGLFRADCQRVKDGIGSTEDHELQIRFWRAGLKGLYDPSLIVHADVQPERMTKAYHRRWHTGHGRFSSIMRVEHLELANARLFGVPGHFYRQALIDSASWIKQTMLGHEVEAFETENKLRFFAGLYSERRKEYSATQPHGTAREIAMFLRKSLARERNGRAIREEVG